MTDHEHSPAANGHPAARAWDAGAGTAPPETHRSRTPYAGPATRPEWSWRRRTRLIDREVERIYPEATRLETVLVASADWRTRRQIRGVLADHGYVVRETTSGDDAVLRAARSRPAVIVMDLDLSAMDGWTAAEYLRRNLATEEIPLLAVHAEASEITRRRLHRAGFSGVLVPPLRAEEVLAMLDRALARSRRGGGAPGVGGNDEPV